MSNGKKLIFLIGDVVVLYISLALTLIVRYGTDTFPSRFENHFAPFSIIFVFWLLIFFISDLYKEKTFRNRSTLMSALALAIIIANAVSAIIFYLFGAFFELTPKTNLALFSIIFFALDAGMRMFLIKMARTGAIPFIIIGDSPLIREVADDFHKNTHTGYRFVRWFKSAADVPHAELRRLVAEGEANLIVLQPHLAKDFSNSSALYALLPLGVELMSFPDFYEIIFEKIPLEEVREDWFLENISTRRRFYDTCKRIIDFSLAVIIGLILLPFALVIALFIKLTSRGPVIYKPQRAGKNNSIITIYKFRTMNVIDEGPLWTGENDARITAFGKLLRFTHLDEIPQLWNILQGDISFTGPRPEHVKLAEQFEKFPYYEIRHVVKPGLTGWAQINYRPSASLKEAYEKLKYDIFYIKNRSFLLDIMIILKTAKYVFTRHD